MTQDIDGVAPRFAQLMVLLAEAYPATRLREGTVRVYYQALRDIPDDDLEAAMARAVKESEFFPSVAYIRKMAQPTVDDAAVLAWGSLGRAAQRIGAWQSLVVEDTCCARALVAAFGSWPAFCETGDGPALALKRQEFLAAYRDAVRHVRDKHAVRLPGLCESSGKYEHVGPCWAGQLAADGSIAYAREPDCLPPEPARNRLTSGDQL